MKTILISQCLQNDFVRPIGKYDNLPNLLHVGYDESTRLMGSDPTKGPMSLFMNWLSTSDSITKIHIRDWHSRDESDQVSHLDKFGTHCVQGTDGANFIFSLDKNAHVVNSTTLNDFVEPDLNELLAQHKDDEVRIGLIGVWTEAKVFFTAYDIATRYPQFNISICAALCASSSVHTHYAALNQMSSILGVQIIKSIGQFTQFLTWDRESISIDLSPSLTPQITSAKEVVLSDTDEKLIKYVFRHSREISVNVLDGGFSGNIVIGTESVDLNGHQEAKHVVKIGEQEEIGKERMSFEIIEDVLGNNAPRIIDFADSNGRGIIKYRYASMGEGESSSFQNKFCSGESLEKIKNYLNIIFREQLGKFYMARTHEKMNLLSYYEFDKVTPSLLEGSISKVYKGDLNRETLTLHDHSFPNPLNFYRGDLKRHLQNSNMYAFQSFVHGDLNGANIIVDGQDNVWIIDFFHTHRGHVLKDLIKLENDLLYIFSDLQSKSDFEEALKISQILFSVSDLQAPLPTLEETGISLPSFVRIYQTLSHLRGFYSSLVEWDRNPLQLLIAQLRYSMHTITFEECNQWQREWALYNSGHFSQLINEKLIETDRLTLDFISSERVGNDFIALTILPGRKDYSRDLNQDLLEIKKNQIRSVITLITKDEMDYYGVPNLFEEYKKQGLDSLHMPMVDQKTPSLSEIETINNYINSKRGRGEKVLIHCVGGLGRSGLVAACYLKSMGSSSDEAIRVIRETRGPRAVESREQERFVSRF